MRTVTDRSTGERSGLTSLAISWAAGVLMWLVVIWGGRLLVGAAMRAENTTLLVAASWLVVLLGPLLAAAVAVLVLPVERASSAGTALLAGVLPVILGLLVASVLLEDGRMSGGMLGAGAVLVLAIAVVTSLVVAFIVRRGADR